jgi:hypothetical protein
MPEHDTFDLDAAFARLEQDIAGVSSPRGAGLAVATARRRRRTTFGAAAAVAVLAVGGVVLGQGLGHDHAVAPADQLPVPAPLDGPHLNAATRDWTPAWGTQTDAGQAKFSETFGGPCLAGPRHGRAGLVTLANDHVDVAFAAMSDYGSHSVVEATDWFKIERRMAGCHRAHQVSSFSDASGALGRTYRIDAAPSDTAPEYLWIVSTGREIGVLKIFGQSDPLPSANDRPVADALLAAVQLPESYVLSRTSTGQTTIGISATDFGAALGDWQSGWSATGGKRDLGSMRCEADISRDALYGQGTFLGANGDQETFGFDTPTAARKAMRSVEPALASCSSGTYDVRTVPFQGGSVTVASGSGPRADVVWLVQEGAQIAYVVIPAGGTAPPDIVNQRVGALLQADLSANATSSVSSPSLAPSSVGPATGTSGTVTRASAKPKHRH